MTDIETSELRQVPIKHKICTLGWIGGFSCGKWVNDHTAVPHEIELTTGYKTQRKWRVADGEPFEMTTDYHLPNGGEDYHVLIGNGRIFVVVKLKECWRDIPIAEDKP